MAGIRLTDKMNLLADARFSLLMERRKREGKATMNPTIVRCVMWAIINRSDRDGGYESSQKLLGIESETNERTVRRVVALMREEGIVQVQPRRYDHQNAANIYQIDWETFAELKAGGRLVGPDHHEDSQSSGGDATLRTTSPQPCGQPVLTPEDCEGGDLRTGARDPEDWRDNSPIEIARRSSDPQMSSNEIHLSAHPSAESREVGTERLSAPGEKLAGGWATHEEVEAWKSRLAKLDYPVMNPLTICEEFRLEHTEAVTVYREFDRKRIQAAACAVRKYLRDGQAIENPTGLLLRILRRRSRPAERTRAGQLAGRIHAIRSRPKPVQANPFETIAREVAS